MTGRRRPDEKGTARSRRHWFDTGKQARTVENVLQVMTATRSERLNRHVADFFERCVSTLFEGTHCPGTYCESTRGERTRRERTRGGFCAVSSL
jgi:hypothetical protein